MTSKLHTPRPLLAALLAGLAAMPAAFAVAPVDPPAIYREGEVLVRYRGSALDAPARTLKERHGMVSRGVLPRGRLELLQLPRFTTTAAALELLRDDPEVELAEPNFLRFPRIACPDNAGLFCPDDTFFFHQWGLRSTGQANYASTDPALASIPGADMDMLLAWDPGADGTFERVGDAGVVIAIVDDGITPGHADLIDNLLPGYDFTDDDTLPAHGPGEGHGTLVAGAAGARGNNNLGVAGTAWNAKLMPLRFAFDTAGHVAALIHARDNGAHIVNASFGGPGFSQAELDAIRDLDANGILYVAAAGNDDSNTDVAVLNYPANYDSPNIVSVAATNRQDEIASFSQYGALTTEVAAPGLQIVTTSRTGYTTPSNCLATGACGVSGTSFSSPYTAGIAALILSAHPTATAAEVKARLIEGAEPGNGVNLRTAGGRVNAAQSLDIAARPALVIKSVELVDTDANAALDPGETLQIAITVENLWLQATNVSGTLSADNGVTADSTPVDFGTVAGGATVTRSFPATVAAGITEHRYVHFTLALTADGGYTATRGFISEIGRLGTNELVIQAFAPRDVDLYDEFHAWHYDFDGTLPAGHTQLVIETTSGAPGLSSPDIDLLVKRSTPPHYNITVGTNPEAPGFFCTSATAANCLDPNVFMSADFDGAERVAISNPVAGTYHIVIVNFAQLDGGLTYTLRAYTRVAPGTVRGNGGGLSLPLLALFGLAALARRLRAA